MNSNINGYGNDSHSTFYMNGEGVIVGLNVTVSLAKGGSSHTGSLLGAIPPSKSKSFFKFGTSAWEFKPGSNDSYIEYPTSDDWNLNVDEFTLDMWVAFPAFTYSVDFIQTLYGIFQTSSAYRGLVLDVSNTHSTMVLKFLIADGGVNKVSLTSPDIKSIIDEYIHIAIVKSGTSYVMYFNGIACDTDAGASYSDINIPLIIGDKANAIGLKMSGGLTNIHMDEIRYSPNIIRWNRDFTLPNRAY